MQLIEAIIDANHRALAGDSKAGVHVADFADELPLIALTCIDPRLNRLFPGALALSEQHFIWLRNAGNIIFGTTSTMMRSLSLACAVIGGKEIAIIGHTDCQVRKTSQPELLQRYQNLGVPRGQLPDDLAEFFGIFTSEQDNVLRSTNYVRSSPLIGPRIPVHGLMIDTMSGRLEWVVNGYQALERAANFGPAMQMPELGGARPDFSKLGAFNLGEMKFPEQKIGEVSTNIGGALPELRTEALSVGEVAAKKIVEELPVAKPPPPIRVPPPIPSKYTHTGSWRAKP